MKKLYILLFLMFFSVFTFSQEKDVAKGLIVANKTKCTQFFSISYVNQCNCGYYMNGGGSDIIKIAPDKEIDVFHEGIIQKDVFITAVKVGGGYYCSGSGPVGQPCSGHPLTYSYIEYTKESEECKECTQTLATWKPGDCESPAMLIFTVP